MAAGSKRIPNFRALLDFWREDFATHDRRWVEPGFHALALYRFGVWVDGIRFGLVRFPLRQVYFVLNALIELAYGVRLQYQSELGRRVRLAHAGSGIIIAQTCVIGDDCLLRQNVTLGGRSLKNPGAPRLGARVEIGANAVLIGPITVGDDVLIGPNTVVRRDVPSNTSVFPPDPVLVPRHKQETAPPVARVSGMRRGG